MIEFLSALLAPALWAASNHFNKFLVSRAMPGAGVGAVVIFAALVGVIVFPIALILQHEAFTIGATRPLSIALNDCLYLLALIPFLKALSISDASSVIPILQVIPVISFLLANIFLGEVLTRNQLLGGMLVLLGALVISVEPHSTGKGPKLAFNASALGLMLLSALLYSVSFLFFKAAALKVEFWTIAFWESTIAFWESIGLISYAGILLTCARSYRDDFLAVLRSNKRAAGLAMANEVINIIAKIVFNYFSLWVPITMAWLGVSFQSVFVLVYSIVLGRMFPHISKEAVQGGQLLRKGLAITVMLVGALVMYRDV